MSKLLFTVILFLFISCNYVLGQSNYLKLIEKEKFSKVEKKISKGLKKEPDNIELNYIKSLLLVQRTYKDYDCKESYTYALKSINLLNNSSDDKELKYLTKISLNKNVLDILVDTICRQAIEYTISQNTESAYIAYLQYYKIAPSKYIKEATSKRNSVAYKDAKQINTIASFQKFIEKYPNADQIPLAISERNTLAYEDTKNIDNMDSYKLFIKNYPNANQVGLAQERIHELAYVKANKLNTSIAYEEFIKEYPNSKQYKDAYKLFEQRQYEENIEEGNVVSYKLFITRYNNNSWVPVAQDSLINIGYTTKDLSLLEYCINNFKGDSRKDAKIKHYKLFTSDGERITLDLYSSKFDTNAIQDLMQQDYIIANKGDQLKLHENYNSDDYELYSTYIKNAAPKEKAFVALQAMIKSNLVNENWQAAIDTINNYMSYFREDDKKLLDLIKTLNMQYDNSIKIQSVGGRVNTLTGGEYVPVITADDQTLYFCGKYRDDNIGGEDIYCSKKYNGYWNNAQLVRDLSTSTGNEAPLNISTDGNTIITFISGDLFYSNKTATGWTTPREFNYEINKGSWQADAMITSDGKALMFASVREGNYNLHLEKNESYHGSYNYAADIYVSLLGNDNEWGNPINLGNIINTPYCDRSPYLHSDMKTLYFSSDGHGGLGELDVFKSVRLYDTCWDCWSEPINMGKEINTTDRDWSYKVSTDGKKAYFAKTTYGDKNDIFYLNLPDHLKPNFVATISGNLLDSNNQPVTAEILWEDLETGNNVGKSKTDPTDGSFFIVLPMGKIYGYYVETDAYFPISDNIDLREKDESVIVEESINMITFEEMIENGTAVPVNNLFFNFSESSLLPYSIPELIRVAEVIISNDLKVEISGHTDNVGNPEENMKLSELRAESVKDFLITKGCDPAMLTTIGYGQTKPITSNTTEEGKSKNRRVELRFIK